MKAKLKNCDCKKETWLVDALYLALRSGLGARTPQPEKQVLLYRPGRKTGREKPPRLEDKKQVAGEIPR